MSGTRAVLEERLEYHGQGSGMIGSEMDLFVGVPVGAGQPTSAGTRAAGA